MNTEKELHALIRSYRYTVLVLSGVIVLTVVAFAGIVMVFVPDTIIAAMEEFYATHEFVNTE